MIVPETGRQSYVSDKRLTHHPSPKVPHQPFQILLIFDGGSQNLLPHHRSTQTWTHHHSLKCLCLAWCGSQNLLYTTEEPSYGQIVKVANVFAWMEVRTLVPSRLAMPPFASTYNYPFPTSQAFSCGISCLLVKPLFAYSDAWLPLANNYRVLMPQGKAERRSQGKRSPLEGKLCKGIVTGLALNRYRHWQEYRAAFLVRHSLSWILSQTIIGVGSKHEIRKSKLRIWNH